MSLAESHSARPGAPGQPRRQRAERRRHPAILINGTAAVVVEVLDLFARWRLGIGEGVGEAHAIHRILHEAVDDLRRLDAGDFVDGGHDVVDVVELRARRPVGLDALRPRDDHRIARAAEMRCDQLGVVERRVAGPRPAGVVHAVGLGTAQRVQAAQLVECRDLLLDGVGDAVLRQQLADGAVLAFGAGAVVAEDVDHDRVVAYPEAIELVDQLAGLRVHVLDEARVDFHQPELERPLGLRNAGPRRHVRRARRELRIGRNPAELLLAREHALAVGIPTGVELALVLAGPLLADLVRTVRRARRPVHEEGLVRRERAMLAQPVDATRRHVLGEVVLLVMGRFDGGRVLDQPRFPLRRFAGEEAVEIVEAVPGRPPVERPHRRGLVGRRVVPLAEGRRPVAVVPQDFGHRRRSLRDHAGVAIPVDRAFGDRAVAHPLVIAPGQQRCARRRADRRGVEGVVADALARELGECRRVHLATERRRLAEADVVQQDDQHIRRAGLQVLRLRAALVHGILQAGRRLARRRHRRKRKHRAIARRGGRRCSMAVDGDACSHANECRHAQTRELLHVFITSGSVCHHRFTSDIAACGHGHFFGYATFVVPMLPLKANGAWSK